MTMRKYSDLIVKIMIFVSHKFGDETNTFLFINIARTFYWCMHFFICDSTCSTLEVLKIFITGFEPAAAPIYKYSGDYWVIE